MAVTMPSPGDYRLDPAASRVAISGRHLFGLGRVRGRFTINAGKIRVGDPITESGIEVSIDAASFNTGIGARDSMVCSKTYLDVARYPTIEFVSTTATLEDDRWALHGDLAVHGVNHQVPLTIERIDVNDGGFTAAANATVNRLDFGMKAMRGMTGDRYTITIEAIAHRI